MSTTPVVAARKTFWDELKPILPALEMAGNVALLASGVGAGIEPLVAGLENSTQSLVQSIGTKPTVSVEIMNVYATAIGVLATLKQIPGLPAATLAKIDEYVIAAQNGTAAYLQASQGFNPAAYQPVAPIV